MHQKLKGKFLNIIFTYSMYHCCCIRHNFHNFEIIFSSANNWMTLFWSRNHMESTKWGKRAKHTIIHLLCTTVTLLMKIEIMKKRTYFMYCNKLKYNGFDVKKISSVFDCSTENRIRIHLIQSYWSVYDCMTNG